MQYSRSSLEKIWLRNQEKGVWICVVSVNKVAYRKSPLMLPLICIIHAKTIITLFVPVIQLIVTLMANNMLAVTIHNQKRAVMQPT